MLKPARRVFLYRCKVVSLVGTIATLKCPMGHEFKNDVAVTRHGRMADVLAVKLAKYWENGVSIACEKCEHDKGFSFKRPLGYLK